MFAWCLQDDYECTTKMISTAYWPESCTPLTTVFDLIQAVRNLNSQKEEDGSIIIIDRLDSFLLNYQQVSIEHILVLEYIL